MCPHDELKKDWSGYYKCLICKELFDAIRKKKIKEHHIIVVVAFEGDKISEVKLANEQYEDAFPNGSVYNTATGLWEYCVDQNLDNDYIASEHIAKLLGVEDVD